MAKYKPPSIEDEGIDKYLDRTKDDHRGLPFWVFAVLVEAEVNLANLKRAMNIGSNITIKKYLALYKKWKAEQQIRQAKADAEVDELNGND